MYGRQRVPLHEMEEFKELRRVLGRLGDDEKKAALIVLYNVSIGDLLFHKALFSSGVKNTAKALEALVSLGVVEVGQGCVNLAGKYRAALSRAASERRATVPQVGAELAKHFKEEFKIDKIIWY